MNDEPGDLVHGPDAKERSAIGAVALDRRPALDDLVTSSALEESVLEPIVIALGVHDRRH